MTKTKVAKATKKTSPAKTTALAKKNIDNAAKEPKLKTITKYSYPDDATDQKARKDFRRKARQTYARLNKEVRKWNKSKEADAATHLHKAQKELQKFQESTYQKEVA